MHACESEGVNSSIGAFACAVGCCVNKAMHAGLKRDLPWHFGFHWSLFGAALPLEMGLQSAVHEPSTS